MPVRLGSSKYREKVAIKVLPVGLTSKYGVPVCLSDLSGMGPSGHDHSCGSSWDCIVNWPISSLSGLFCKLSEVSHSKGVPGKN